jgi:hypothetical protein
VPVLFTDSTVKLTVNELVKKCVQELNWMKMKDLECYINGDCFTILGLTVLLG